MPSPNAAKYYKHIQMIPLWRDKLEYVVQNIKKEKVQKEELRRYYVELYAIYLQFIEIFCINIFAIAEDDIEGNIFLRNHQIQEKIIALLDGKNKEGQAEAFMDYYLKHWVIPFKEAREGNAFDPKISLYKRILAEIISDYLGDKDLINAYKHGHRLYGGTESRLSAGSGKNRVVLGSYNAKITYFAKNGGQLFRNQISFNWERVHQKFMFLFNMLENSIEVITRVKEHTIAELKEIQTLGITDQKEFNRYLGFFRWSDPVSSESLLSETD